MERITVKKEELLSMLKKNREEHREVFLEALEGFRKKAIQMLEERLTLAKAGKHFDLYLHIVQPVDQTKDYDRAIKMLEMSIDVSVELSERDFQQYVLDDWSWKDQFLISNSLYSGKAAAMVASAGLQASE